MCLWFRKEAILISCTYCNAHCSQFYLSLSHDRLLHAITSLCDTAVEGEDGPPHGEVVEHTADDCGEKDIPTERKEEGPVAFSEGESENKDEQVKLMAMAVVLPNECVRLMKWTDGGTAMDLSETNTEDSDSSYPDDLIPSQLYIAGT